MYPQARTTIAIINRLPILKPNNVARSPLDQKEARRTSIAFERRLKMRERQERQERAAEAKERASRDRDIEVAKANLERSRRDHRLRLAELQKLRAALDKQFDTEEARWRAKEEELESALRRARVPT